MYAYIYAHMYTYTDIGLYIHLFLKIQATTNCWIKLRSQTTIRP